MHPVTRIIHDRKFKKMQNAGFHWLLNDVILKWKKEKEKTPWCHLMFVLNFSQTILHPFSTNILKNK